MAAIDANRGIAFQAADGTNPEKEGGDTSDQDYGLLMAQRDLTTCQSAKLQAQVKSVVILGLDWLSSKIDDRGQVLSVDDTRTGVEAARTGTTKSIDDKTIIQAFSFAIEVIGTSS